MDVSSLFNVYKTTKGRVHLTHFTLQAFVTCAVTGPIQIQDPRKIRGSNGEDVFSEKRGLGFIQNKVNINSLSDHHSYATHSTR